MRVAVVGAAVLILLATGIQRGVAAAAQKASKPTAVRVVMTEYHFTLSRRTVPVGTVIFTLVNKGELPHNMSFNGPFIFKRSPLVDPGSTYRLKVTFKKPGSYPFVCTPHFKLGMAGTLRVKR